ncbi:MAG: Arm DNA-binding domain-containing protein [Oceanicoccus sp.]
MKSDRDGVCVRVSPKGKITYSLRYYYNGKQTTADIGTYPLMTLKEARTENQRLRKKLEQGHDPKVVRQLERQAIIAAKSLEGLFDLWYKSYCVKTRKAILKSSAASIFMSFPKLVSCQQKR